MYCRNCGKEVQANAVACMSCGCVPTNGHSFCQNCGNPVSNNQVVCTKCGSAVGDAAANPPSGVTAPKSRTIAALLAFFLGAFGAHQFYLGNHVSGGIRVGITIIGSFVTAGAAAAIMDIIGIVEAIIYFTRTDEQFYSTYVLNRKQWF